MVSSCHCTAVLLLIICSTSSKAKRASPSESFQHDTSDASSALVPYRYLSRLAHHQRTMFGRVQSLRLQREDHFHPHLNGPKTIRKRRFNNDKHFAQQQPSVNRYDKIASVPRRNVHLMLRRRADRLAAYLLREETLGNINLKEVSTEHGISEIQVGTRIRGSSHRGGVFPDLLIDDVSSKFLQNMAKYIIMQMGTYSSDFSRSPQNLQLVRMVKNAVRYAHHLKRNPNLVGIGEVPGPESLAGTLHVLRAFQVGLRQVLFKVGYDDVIKFGTHDSFMRHARKNDEPTPLDYWLRKHVGDCRLHAATGSLMMQTLPKHIVTNVRYAYAVAPEQEHWDRMADHAFTVYTIQLGSMEAEKFGSKEIHMIADNYNRRLDGRVVRYVRDADRLQLEITPHRLVRSDENTWEFEVLSEDASRPTLERADMQLASEELWSKEVPESLRLDLLPYPDIQNPKSLLQAAETTREHHRSAALADDELGNQPLSEGAAEVEVGEWYRPFLPMEECFDNSQCLNGICTDDGICSPCGTMILADTFAQRMLHSAMSLSPVFPLLMSHTQVHNLSLLESITRVQYVPIRSEFRFISSTAHRSHLSSQGLDLLRSIINQFDKGTQTSQINMLENSIEHGMTSQLWQDPNGNVLLFDYRTANHVVISLKDHAINDTINSSSSGAMAMQFQSTKEQWFDYYTGKSQGLFGTAMVPGNTGQRKMRLQCQSVPEVQFTCPLLQLELLGWRFNSVPYEKLSFTRAHIKRGLDRSKIESSFSDSALWHVSEIIESMTDGKVLLKKTASENYETCTTNRYAVRLSRREFWQRASKLSSGMEFLPNSSTGGDDKGNGITGKDWAFDRYTGKRWVLNVKGAISEPVRSLGLFEAQHAVWDDEASVFWLDDENEDVVHTPVFRLKCLEHIPPHFAEPVSAQTCVNSWSKLFQYFSSDWA